MKTVFFFFFFGEHLRFVSSVLGLGLEHSCPWPRECLSSERLSLASDFFVSLASSLVSSTPPLGITLISLKCFWSGCKSVPPCKFYNLSTEDLAPFIHRTGTNQFALVTLAAHLQLFFVANNKVQPHRSINYCCSQFPKIFRSQLPSCI